MTMILLLGLGAVVACVGIAAWKIYGPPKPGEAAQPPPPEHNGKNWIASDFPSDAGPSTPHSPSSESSNSTAEAGDSGV